MDDDGWGRLRPNFADLLPSVSDDDGQEPMDDMPMDREDPQHLHVQRVIPLKDYPIAGFDGAPLAELNQKYVSDGLLKQDQVQKLKKFYTTWPNGDNSNTKHTCIFTCPVTGEHFAAGNWDNEKGVTIVDGVCWYNLKKVAMNAAAARALDCFSLRRCHGTEKAPFQRCLDSPYLSSPAGNAPKLPELSSGVVLPTPFSQGNEGVHAASPPKQALNDWYISFTKKLDIVGIVVEEPANESGPRNECYSCWSNNLYSPNTLFTAIFTCHLTGERFKSGKVFGEEDAYKEDYWYYDRRESVLIPRGGKTNGEDDACESDGVDACLGLQRINFVWYKTKKEATAAAAGHAVDCLRHRDSPHDAIPGNRYCKESPYTFDNAPEIWKLVSESVQRVGGVVWVSLPHDYRLTTRFGVPDLHSLLVENHDEDYYWRDRYRERRRTDENDL
mmetsp:Transcript_21305/g.38564  ORF Transcript_21305/g.38564 Transcript_21305/m.38564 type:complete len:443 (+) Transcript_21305:146-1474(+)|eukprot:CAMPEP_0201978870 /NCGR_PEP_ID=MMETSP0904-20121228/65496_1 /ASSEMBLY_ACC=CAM_ASM_000553 /TAXON_ID=420261 /ORGANISM="Thalassiosira antarctica, Strain CCMP982" /LENGTH=442 /DNA_ID=CAMNT_0048530685 /DNA_START=98 /DNA_END=1426 /DNA_ORIENTATION=+